MIFKMLKNLFKVVFMVLVELTLLKIDLWE